MIPGSPATRGDVEEGDADGGASDFRSSSENQNEKQKVTEHLLNWRKTYGRGEDIEAPNYDKEVSHNHTRLLTNGREVCFFHPSPM